MFFSFVGVSHLSGEAAVFNLPRSGVNAGCATRAPLLQQQKSSKECELCGLGHCFTAAWAHIPTVCGKRNINQKWLGGGVEVVGGIVGVHGTARTFIKIMNKP